MGYQVDDYSYKPSGQDGYDGKLGNEEVCLVDEVRGVVFGQSWCAETSWFGYTFIDSADAFAESATTAPQQDPNEIFTTDDMFGDTSENWDGCYTLNQGWGGYSDGQCPTINDNHPSTYPGQINYGYVEQTLTNTAAINQALKDQGIEVTGYTYSWKVKNYNASTNQRGIDTFDVTLTIRDDKNQEVYSKTYDYSRIISDWEEFAGSETFENPFNADQLSEIELSITGKDVGYWAGYYGPEFAAPDVRLNYRYSGNPVAEDTTAEDTIFDQQCASDPLSNPTCPEYNNAMIAQIANTNTSGVMGTDSTGTGIDDSKNNGLPEIAFDGSIKDDTSGAPDPTGLPDALGVPDSTGIAEATGTIREDNPIQEAVAEAAGTPEPVAEAAGTPDPVAEASGVAASGGSKKGTGLNATQLATLDAAQAVSATAEASASESAVASGGVGLDENGGVGSALTSVDPTGSTNSSGQLASGSNGTGDMMSSTGNFGGVDDATGTTFESTTGSDIDIAGSTTFGQNSNTGQNNTGATIDNMNTGDMQFDQTASMGQDSTGAEADEQFAADQTAQSMEDSLAQESVFDNDNAFTPGDVVDEIVMAMTNNMIQQAVVAAEEVVEESAEASYEEQNAQEDNLVAAAQSGDDSEEAQAALLGYNPNFRAYQQDQMPGGDIYNDQGVYENQKTYDNPNGRLFNGASDALHREMVRQQYELGN